MIGVGKGASHLNLNSGTCKTCGTGKTDDCLNLTGGACENPVMLNSANCLIYCPTRLTCPTRPKVCEALFILNSSLFTNQQAKPFIRRGRKARLKGGAA